MAKLEIDMPDELLYSNAMEWIHENPQDQHLSSEEIKQACLSFNTLPQENKVELLTALSKLLQAAQLPLEIEKWLLSDFDALPDKLLLKIGSHLKDESDINNLVSTSKRMYSLFQPTRLLDKFLQQVAYGEQDKAEWLFTEVYQGNVEKIQRALCYQRRFTDYSGRTFHCSAYEYAYWAKDTHMCRMLERHMDDATKAQMLARIEQIERIDEATGKPVGLKYQQHGAEHQSAHFDLTPLITALQEYITGYAAWRAAENWAAMRAAWMKVGMAKRDVPAHVAQECCRTDRSFFPLPSFNVDREDIPRETLPRVLAFCNWDNDRDELWFPIGQVGAGLGLDFALIHRYGGPTGLWDFCCCAEDVSHAVTEVRRNLAAITRLEEVRTADLTLSRDHLNPPVRPMELSM